MNHQLANAPLIEPTAQMLGLSPRARIAIENETTGGILPAEPVLHHLVDHFVGNQGARLHRGDHHRSGGRAFGPQHVARRHVWDPQALLEQLGLRTLSRTWGTKQNQSVHKKQEGETFRRYSADPGSAPIAA